MPNRSVLWHPCWVEGGVLIKVDHKDVRVGERYAVSFHDCCVEGRFTAVVTMLLLDPHEGGVWIDAVEFDNGVVLTETQAVVFEQESDAEPA